MALTVTKLLADVHDASTTTGWTADGNWGSLATDSAIFREGGTGLRGQVSQSAGHCYYGITSVDLTAAANRRVYAWILPPGSLDTKANGGLRIVIGDGTNRIAYYVGGSDEMGFQVGAWTCVMLDANDPPSSFAALAGSEASLSWTAVTEIGIGVNNPAKATGNSPNAWFDIVRYGTGLRITSAASDDITFTDLASDDASTSAGKAYGIIREIQPGVFGVQGDLVFGDTGTGTIDFKDQDAVVVIEDHVHGTGTPTNFQIKGDHNASGTFSLELGIAIGTGDSQRGRNGVTFLNSNTSQAVDFDFSDADIETVLMYGCSLASINGTVVFSADATNGPNHKISGCSFGGSRSAGQVAAGRAVFRNCTFSGFTSDTESAFLWNANIDVKRCAFVGNTDSTNDPAGIEHPTAGTFTYTDLTFSGNDVDIRNTSGGLVTINATGTSDPVSEANGRYSGSSLEAQQFDYNGGPGTYTNEDIAAQDTTVNDMNLIADADEVEDAYYFGHSTEKFYQLDVNIGTAGSGTWTVTWEYWNGSSWTALAGVTDGTTGFTAAAGFRLVTYTFPGDWALTTVNSVSAFWIRARVTAWTSVTTAPLGTQAALIGDVDINNTKTVTVTAQEADGTKIESARVILESDGSPLPSDASVTITRSGSVASVSHTAHGLNDGDKVAIRDANEIPYNGLKTITNVTTNAYDYTVSGSPDSPATGSITATAVVLTGTTNASGVLQTTAFQYASDQPVRGLVRKSTTSVRYKTFPLAGTILVSGFSTIAIMTPDE